VLLDLDGTLISSFTPKRAPRLPPTMRTHLVGQGSGLNPAGVFVVERPGLTDFLAELAAFAEVVVFTAGAAWEVCMCGCRCALHSVPMLCGDSRCGALPWWRRPHLPRSQPRAVSLALPLQSSPAAAHLISNPHSLHRAGSRPSPHPPQTAPQRNQTLNPAGLQEYAAPIIDAIDPGSKYVAARVYREGTTRTDHYQCVKDMRRVGRALSRTVLVDDTPLAFLHQPSNGVPVLGFRGDPEDRLLGEAVLPLLQVRWGPRRAAGQGTEARDGVGQPGVRQLFQDRPCVGCAASHGALVFYKQVGCCMPSAVRVYPCMLLVNPCLTAPSLTAPADAGGRARRAPAAGPAV
jgi:RNA polymerase II subunit A small phosphatase-like protein